MEKILVIGDSCKDVFQYGNTPRKCPEASCLVFTPTYKTENYGMAANVVSNIIALDKEVDITFITNQKKPTKIRYVDELHNQMLMRLDLDDIVEEKFDFSTINFDLFSCCVISDYDKGFLSEQDLFKISHSHPLTFLDTKKRISTFCSNFSFVKINEGEWKASCDSGAKALDWTNKLIVTMGEKGALFNGKTYPTDYVPVPSIAGAGDTFLAGFVHSYLKNKDVEKAIQYANQITNIVIRKRGVSTI